MPFVNSEQFLPRSSRTALLMEVVDKDGNKNVLIYHLTGPMTITLDNEYDLTYNIFEPTTRLHHTSTKVTIEGYLGDPRQYDGAMPDPNQAEVEHTKAITDGNEDEIIIDDYEDWDED